MPFKMRQRSIQCIYYLIVNDYGCWICTVVPRLMWFDGGHEIGVRMVGLNFFYFKFSLECLIRVDKQATTGKSNRYDIPTMRPCSDC